MKVYIIIILLVLIYLLIYLNFFKKENFERHSNYNIVMFLTGGLKYEAENCIQSLKNLNIDKNLMVTALDDESYEHISNLGVQTDRIHTNLKKEANFGTKDFYEITYNKSSIINNNLKKYNKVVVYTDTDIVFLKNINDDIDKFIKSDLDVMFQDDSSNFTNTKNYCTGFIMFKPNKICSEILEEAKRIMKNNMDNREKKGGGLADQKAIQESIKNLKKQNKKINISTLDLKDYTNGPRYFNNLNTVYKDYTPKIIHNNYIRGTIKKTERFKKHNLWFI